MVRVEMVKSNKILLAVFTQFGSLNILAAELTFEPFATVGYEQYEAGLFDASGDEVHVKPSYLRADVGALIRWSSLYFELNAGTSESVDVTDSLGNTAGFNRNDFRFKAGYAYRDRYLVFAGFQSSATQLEYAGNIAETLDYDSDGPYIGAGYRQALAFGDMAFNAAYSSRSARIDSTRLLAGDMRPESDGSGFMIDAVLNVPLSPPLGFKAGLEYQAFEYSDWKDFFGNPVPITTPEQLTTIRLGVYASF